MLTPQEVSEHAFAKASFGGYNMAMVDEFLDVLRVPFDRAVAQCLDGTLTDAKTVAAILKAKILLGR